MTAVAAYFERRVPFDVEFRLRTAGGEYRWFNAQGQAVWDDDGRPERMVGSISDVTERKRQEVVIAEQIHLAEFSRDIALALAEDGLLPTMLGRCAELTVGHLDAAFSRIWTVDEAGMVLELQASAGIYTHTDGPHARIPVGQRKIGRIARERRPHLTNCVLGDPLVAEQDWAEREGMVAFAGYPLIVGDRLVGVWAMFARRPLSDSTLAAMASVASGIATGIERKRSAMALLRSEAESRKLALVAARTHNAVILTDPDGHIEWINAGFTRITGYEPAEVIGRTPGSLLQGPRTDPAAVRYMRERQRQGEGFRTEILNYSKDGREYWISIEAQPIHDEDGRLVHFMAIEADITERKQAEEALRQSEERFALAVRGTNEGLWDWDVRTNSVYFSPRLAEFMGNDGGEFAGTVDDWESRIHPDHRDGVFESLSSHLERRTPFDVEYRFRDRDGGYRWLQGRGQAIWDEAGRPVRMVGSVGDITERKRTEQQLRLLQAAVENANDVILITEAEPIDQPGPRVVYVNAAFERATGFASSEILGKTPRILHGIGTDRATLDEIRRDLKRWKPIRVELLNYTKEGREFWVELNIRPVADASGWYTHWVSVQRDITERKRVELESRTRNEGQVRDLNLQLEQRILRLDALRQIDLAISGSLDLAPDPGDRPRPGPGPAPGRRRRHPARRRSGSGLSYAAGKGFRTDGDRRDPAPASARATPVGPSSSSRRDRAPRPLAGGRPVRPRADPRPARASSPTYAVPLVAKGRRPGRAGECTTVSLELHRDRDWPSSRPWPARPPSRSTTRASSATSSGPTPASSRPTTPRSRAGHGRSTSATRRPRGTPAG